MFSVIDVQVNGAEIPPNCANDSPVHIYNFRCGERSESEVSWLANNISRRCKAVRATEDVKFRNLSSPNVITVSLTFIIWPPTFAFHCTNSILQRKDIDVSVLQSLSASTVKKVSRLPPNIPLSSCKLSLSINIAEHLQTLCSRNFDL